MCSPLLFRSEAMSKKKTFQGRRSECRLEHRSFHTAMRKNLFPVSVTEHRSRLPREAEQSPPLEAFQRHLDEFLCELL